MENSILNSIGIDPAIFLLVMLVLILIAFVIVLGNRRKISALEKKYEKFMNGRDGKSMERVIMGYINQLDSIERTGNENQAVLSQILHTQNTAIQKTGLVKYDAFDEMGGKLSFALAMLDREDNGLVLNAVHTRDGCYVYSKEIIKGRAVLLLSDEEQQALANAVQQISQS